MMAIERTIQNEGVFPAPVAAQLVVITYFPA